jgi:hypothetical protein
METWTVNGELGARFKIPDKFLAVAGTEYSRNRNFDRNFDFVPVISGVSKVINVK